MTKYIKLCLQWNGVIKWGRKKTKNISRNRIKMTKYIKLCPQWNGVIKWGQKKT